MEVLEEDSIDDARNALYVLRLNVAGASPEQLGEAPDQFSLSVLELFRHQQHPTGRDSLVVRTVAELREALLTPGDEHGIRYLTNGFA